MTTDPFVGRKPVGGYGTSQGNFNPIMAQMLGNMPMQANAGSGDPRAAFLRATGQSAIGGAGFNPYAAGNKQYGATPNIGPMRDKTPFQERDMNATTKRNAMLRRLKARGARRFMSADNLSGE